MVAMREHAEDLARVRHLLSCERPDHAIDATEQILREDPQGRPRSEALILRFAAILQLDSPSGATTAREEAFEAARAGRDPSLLGQLHALAAIAGQRQGSLDRCAIHLVHSARQLNGVELTDATTAWAWYDLAHAYSDTGFHEQAIAAADRARQVAVSIGARSGPFAAPEIHLRLAVSLDQRGDTDGCHRILRGIAATWEHHREVGDLHGVRPSSRGAFGYALARLAALRGPDPATGAATAVAGPTSERALSTGPALERAVTADLAAVETSARHLLDDAGGSRCASCLRILAAACFAIAHGNAVEAVARLEDADVGAAGLGPAEPYRLRTLAHVAAGDWASAYRAGRHTFRVADARCQRLRELFIEAVAAHLDADELRRTVAGQTHDLSSDPLTGLPDGTYAEEHLTAVLARGEEVLVGVCRLNDLEEINAIHGRSSGDLVLQRVAGILNRVMRSGDLVARIDDEFILLLPPEARPEAREIDHRIALAIAEEDWEALVPATRVGVTVGWAGTADGRPFETAAAALRDAREAAEQARANRR